MEVVCEVCGSYNVILLGDGTYLCEDCGNIEVVYFPGVFGDSENVF